MKYWVTVLFLLAFFLNVNAQQVITDEKETKWQHFKKIEFMLDSIPAWYVEPQKPLSGNPWVWRAHFPNWHTQIDSILLERGFHIAYINTNNLYGHPKALSSWDKFYNYLTTKKGFATKVALEGVSRGGLYAYGWAKRNPSKVSCIYAEAPVCDFKSWPGGKGKSKGSASDWKKLLEVYGFTEEEALNYRDMPKDNLDGLAAYKVPLLHSVGLKDSIVPYAENSFLLINNYIRKGGPATVVPMTVGEHKLEGHHFPIDKPEVIADFIYRNSVPVKPTLKSESFIQQNGNLDNFKFRIRKDKKATIAFLGGSITHMSGWRDKVEQYLKEAYPDVQFTFINAGIPSLGSVPHAFRLKTDVLDKGKIDLMFIESAVNDRVNGTSELQQGRALEGIVRQSYKANPNINLIMMAFADKTKLADYESGTTPLEIKVHQEIAKRYHIPFINLAEEVNHRIKAGEFNWQDDFKNLHPSPFGQEVYFAAIKSFLQKQLIYNSNPVKLSSTKINSAMDKFNYSNGKYLSIEKANIINGFSIIPKWQPGDEYKARSGFFNKPILVGDKPGASLQIPFKGTAIGIAVNSGPDAGIVEYSIDGGAKKTTDLYTQWSKSLHLPWYVILADDLKNGKHTLNITVSDKRNQQSKGTACRIIYFLENN